MTKVHQRQWVNNRKPSNTICKWQKTSNYYQ